jgi:hypothetical protein
MVIAPLSPYYANERLVLSYRLDAANERDELSAANLGPQGN